MSTSKRFADYLHESKTTALDFLAWRSRQPSMWTLPPTRAAVASVARRAARSLTSGAWLPRPPGHARS
jgi:hypothetical protein